MVKWSFPRSLYFDNTRKNHKSNLVVFINGIKVLYPEEGSIAETSVKTLLKSVDFTNKSGKLALQHVPLVREQRSGDMGAQAWVEVTGRIAQNSSPSFCSHFHCFATNARSTASPIKLSATQAVRKPSPKTRVLVVNNICAFSFRRWVNGYFLSGQLKNYLLMKMTVFVNGGSGRGWTDMWVYFFLYSCATFRLFPQVTK